MFRYIYFTKLKYIIFINGVSICISYLFEKKGVEKENRNPDRAFLSPFTLSPSPPSIYSSKKKAPEIRPEPEPLRRRCRPEAAKVRCQGSSVGLG
jgi:hypothetical protein